MPDVQIEGARALGATVIHAAQATYDVGMHEKQEVCRVWMRALDGAIQQVCDDAAKEQRVAAVLACQKAGQDLIDAINDLIVEAFKREIEE